MPQASRDIRRRLKSVTSIKKITRAMELVAAAKMRKSVARVLATRAYADATWDVVMDLLPKSDPSHHPLLQARPIHRVAIVAIASNRGLCGSFNLNVINKAVRRIEKEQWNTKDVAVDFITFGKKGAQILSSLDRNVVADYPKDDVTDAVADILPVSGEVISGFLQGKYDEVCLAYTHFYSSLRQEARIRYLLPLYKPSRFLGHAQNEAVAHEDAQAKVDYSEFYFEPSRDRVLEALLPRLVEVQLYQAVLESEASEHSARMLAMRNATEAGGDMIDDLTFAFNQARQASITAELAEISAGASL